MIDNDDVIRDSSKKKESEYIKKLINHNKFKIPVLTDQDEEILIRKLLNLHSNPESVRSLSPDENNNVILDEEKKNDNNKNFLIRKLSFNSANKENIKKCIDQKFSDSNTYLIPDSKIIIGKKFLYNEDFKKLENKKPYQVIGDLAKFEEHSKLNNLRKEITKDKSHINNAKHLFSNFIKKFLKQAKKEETNMEIITDRKVHNIFEEKERLRTLNLKKDEELYQNIDVKCQLQVKNILQKQEKVLEKKFDTEKKIDNISRFISLKTQKPENMLLMNKTDGFRVKKEIRSTFEEGSLKNTKYGFYNDWIFSLRKASEGNPKNSFTNIDKFNEINQNTITNNKEFSKYIQTTEPTRLLTSQFNLTTCANKCSKSNNIWYSNEKKYNFMKFHKTDSNDIWATIQDKDDIRNINTASYNYEQIRKPYSDSIRILDNFTKCISVDKKFKNLNLKKEDLNKINDMKVNILIFLFCNFLKYLIN